MAAPTALVTGIGGQDGAYLARHLRCLGVRVVGTVEPGGLPPGYAAAYLPDVELVEHDVRDAPGFARLLESWSPGQVYNLAAFSSVGASFDHRELVEQTNAEAVRRMLERLWSTGTGTARRRGSFRRRARRCSRATPLSRGPSRAPRRR